MVEPVGEDVVDDAAAFESATSSAASGCAALVDVLADRALQASRAGTPGAAVEETRSVTPEGAMPPAPNRQQIASATLRDCYRRSSADLSSQETGQPGADGAGAHLEAQAAPAALQLPADSGSASATPSASEVRNDAYAPLSPRSESRSRSHSRSSRSHSRSRSPSHSSRSHSSRSHSSRSRSRSRSLSNHSRSSRSRSRSRSRGSASDASRSDRAASPRSPGGGAVQADTGASGDGTDHAEALGQWERAYSTDEEYTEPSGEEDVTETPCHSSRESTLPRSAESPLPPLHPPLEEESPDRRLEEPEEVGERPAPPVLPRPAEEPSISHVATEVHGEVAKALPSDASPVNSLAAAPTGGALDPPRAPPAEHDRAENEEMWRMQVLKHLATEAESLPGRLPCRPGARRPSTATLAQALKSLLVSTVAADNAAGSQATPQSIAWNSAAAWAGSNSARSALSSRQSSSKPVSLWTPPSPPAPSTNSSHQSGSDLNARLPVQASENRDPRRLQYGVPGLDMSRVHNGPEVPGRGLLLPPAAASGNTPPRSKPGEPGQGKAVLEHSRTVPDMGSAMSGGAASPLWPSTGGDDVPKLPLQRSASAGELRCPPLPASPPRPVASTVTHHDVEQDSSVLDMVGAVLPALPQQWLQQAGRGNGYGPGGGPRRGAGARGMAPAEPQLPGGFAKLPPVHQRKPLPGKNGAMRTAGGSSGHSRAKATIVSHMHVHHHHHYHVLQSPDGRGADGVPGAAVGNGLGVFVPTSAAA